MNQQIIKKIDFSKGNGLVPVVVQDFNTKSVLMLGYMNSDALNQTLSSGFVTFWSRSKNRLWTKGEESGNTLKLVSLMTDCDDDSILVKVIPNGPTCHRGTDTCWGEENRINALHLERLENTINERKGESPESSYTAYLFDKGLNKIAQKVGEEAVELVIESKDDDDELFLNEAADLMYHYLVLLSAKNKTLEDVLDVLKIREK